MQWRQGLVKLHGQSGVVSLLGHDGISVMFPETCANISVQRSVRIYERCSAISAGLSISHGEDPRMRVVRGCPAVEEAALTY